LKEGENEVEGIEAEDGAPSAHSTRTPESLYAPPYVPHDLHHVIHQSAPSTHSVHSEAPNMFANYEDF